MLIFIPTVIIADQPSSEVMFPKNHNILPSTKAVVINWNYSTYKIEKHLSGIMVDQPLVNRKNKVVASYFFDQNNIVHIYPSCKQNSYQLIDVPYECVSLMSLVRDTFHPKNIIALQTGGLSGMTKQDLLSIYSIRNIFYIDRCYAVKPRIPSLFPDANMIYTQSYLGAHYPTYCGDNLPVLQSSDSLSIPIAFNLQHIDKTRLLILVCVTDLDTDEQFQAIDEYQETKEVAAQLLVDKSQLILQSLNTAR